MSEKFTLNALDAGVLPLERDRSLMKLCFFLSLFRYLSSEEGLKTILLKTDDLLVYKSIYLNVLFAILPVCGLYLKRVDKLVLDFIF